MRRAAQAALEHRHRQGRLVEHLQQVVDEDPMPGGERAAERAVVGMHVAIGADVVAVIEARRRVERQQPDRRDAEVAQVVEALDQPVDVTDSIVGRVLECANVNLVKDRILEP